MEEKIICPRCGNTDLKYFGNLNGKLYCRKCITFQGDGIEYQTKIKKEINYQIKFELSEKQKEISQATLDNYTKGINTLIYAVTGAGKTEIVYETIAYVLSNGQTVGFAIPRKDVVIELLPRIKEAFPMCKVVAVYGEHNSDLRGDIILLTTHQLFRYKNYFDLLIIDEIDAFPYQDNQILEYFSKKSIRKNYIYMSATPSEKIKRIFLKEGFSVLTLFSRFHKNSLPIPKVIKSPDIFQYFFIIKLLKKFHEKNKRVLVFLPTIDLSEKIFKYLKLFFKKINFVNSKRKNKDQIVDDFREKRLTTLITTSILERGITIDDLQVIVMFANHQVYSSQTLIQISGRVGRNIKHPQGHVFFLTSKVTINIKNAIKDIRYFNENM